MHNPENKIIEIIEEHINQCLHWFTPIKNASDFIHTQDGLMRLDAVAMRLQAIGENVKNLIRIQPGIIEKYPDAKWDDIVRFRDFISHHYEMLDHDIIFNICLEYLPVLKKHLETESRENKK